MNCQQAQDRLFAADSLDGEPLPADAAAHIADCPACGAVLARLCRVEAAAHDLPDAAEGSAVAKQAFLARIGALSPPRQAPKPKRPPRPPRLLLLRSAVVRWPRLAVAA